MKPVQICLKAGDKPYELQGDVCGDEACNKCGQSIWAADFDKNHRNGYKSDRNQNARLRSDVVRLKTLCTGCCKLIDCHWPKQMTFAGSLCSPQEYIAKTLQSKNVGIYCDDCMEGMPDVKLEDLRLEP